MDLELQQRPLEEYIPVYRATWGQEETLETIVPDSLPDAARVVTVSGEAFTKEKITSDGKVRLSGSIRAVILYIPDGEDSPRAMEVTLPFQADRDDPRMRADFIVHGSVTAAACDARLMNPRKLLLRCELMCGLTVYEKTRRSISAGIQAGSDISVETQMTSHICRVITEAVEKNFAFSDVLKPSAAKPPVDELLWGRMQNSVCEGKVIGRKLVCKGDFLLAVLYRSGKSVIPIQFELPYSQVVELSSEWPEADAELSLVMRQMDLRMREGELEVTAEMALQACVWSSCRVDVLCDAYSTVSPFAVERTKQELCVGAESQKKRRQVRHFIELGVPARQVVDCRCETEGYASKETEQGVTCESRFCVDVLYLSEDDTLCAVSRTVPVSLEVPEDSGSRLRWSCRPAGEISAVPVTGGVEVRFECDYECMLTRTEQIQSVAEIRPAESVSDMEPRPSVIIRIVGVGETLWDIAKSCGSSVADICTVNGLSGDAAPEGANLLIPIRKKS